MNEEQNSPENGSETVETGDKASPGTDNTSQQSATGGESAAAQDDYYEVDHGKKEVISTIGDGEMHNEGLVGEGVVSTDFQSTQDEFADEQDAAELRDSEG